MEKKLVIREEWSRKRCVNVCPCWTVVVLLLKQHCVLLTEHDSLYLNNNNKNPKVETQANKVQYGVRGRHQNLQNKDLLF